MKLALAQPSTESDFERYYDLRYRVLRAPWGEPRGSERIDGDDAGYHLMALDTAWEPATVAGVGCLIFTAPGEARIRSMAVDPNYQGRGVGRFVMRGLEDEAALLGITTITLQARENALEFYLHLGYQNLGKSFIMFGSIQHYLMTKPINTKRLHANT
ncbi:MAG: GNAT family N-acetyltransferase [Verrucomicrobiota bacterium]|nr:GNAT family N-acetyltransferase [Verrucomicrobiota bacterium]